MDWFKRSDWVVILFCYGSEDDMVLNPTLAVLSDITCGGWYFIGVNRTLLYLKFASIFVYRKGFAGSA